VNDGDDRVLILRRHGDLYAGGGWSLPGGKVEYGQTIEEAIAKELREETALTCRSSNFLFYQDNPPEKSGDMHCINLYFECTVSGSMMLNEESSDFAWITQAELDQYDMVFLNGEGLTRYWATKS
jgi:8-oxo-dGTP diphosphatase